eukprot:IDg2963t1
MHSAVMYATHPIAMSESSLIVLPTRDDARALTHASRQERYLVNIPIKTQEAGEPPATLRSTPGANSASASDAQSQARKIFENRKAKAQPTFILLGWRSRFGRGRVVIRHWLAGWLKCTVSTHA